MILQRIGNQGLRLGRLFERAAARYPANVLILDHSLDVAPGLGRRATTAEVADLVDELSARLWWARVRPGERVAVYKGDGFDITLLACAASRIGAVPVLLSPSLAPSTAAELLARAGRPHLLTDETTLNRLRVSGADVSGLTQSVLLTAGTHPDARNLRESSDTPRVAPVDLSADHPALVTHTSGTTGVPKLAVHTARSLQARYRPQASTVIPLILGREPIAMHVSFVHSRLVTALAIALRRGWPVLMLRDAETSHVAELFARLRPGILEAHPNSFLEWEELVDDPRRPLSRVKLFSSTFDAIHPRTVHRLLRASERRAPVFGQLYGQSEVGPAAFRGFTRSRSLEDDGRCVGVPFPGFVDVRVVSRNGQPPSAANPGHIEVRSDGRVITYIGESERYRQQMSDDGWWRMGDVGYRTKWGCGGAPRERSDRPRHGRGCPCRGHGVTRGLRVLSASGCPGGLRLPRPGMAGPRPRGEPGRRGCLPRHVRPQRPGHGSRSPRATGTYRTAGGAAFRPVTSGRGVVHEGRFHRGVRHLTRYLRGTGRSGPNREPAARGGHLAGSRHRGPADERRR